MFNEVYNKVLPMWGSALHFEDGMVLEPKSSFKSLITKNPPKDYFYSAKLSNTWNAIEKSIGSEDREETLMVEAMYQVFNDEARKLFENGIFELQPTLGKTEIEALFLKKLKEDQEEE